MLLPESPLSEFAACRIARCASSRRHGSALEPALKPRREGHGRTTILWIAAADGDCRRALFERRARRRFGLSCDHGSVLGRAGDDAADRARAQPGGRDVRRGAIRARGQTNWRLLAGVRSHGALPAAFIGGSIASAGDLSTSRWSASCCCWRRRGCSGSRHGLPRGRADAVACGHPAGRRRARPACRPDRHRRRDFPQPSDHPVGVGRGAADVGRRRGVHRAQFGRRAAGNRRVGRPFAARVADLPRRRCSPARCSAPGSASSGFLGRGCCRRSRWC